MSGQPVGVLGAGHGRRMGEPKVFTRVEGETFLERILARCRETASPVTLTLDPGFRQEVETLLAALPEPRPRIVEVDGTLPMLASVQAALGAGGFDGGFWCWPVDAPFISAMGWDQAVETVRGQPEEVWKLRAGGRTGHPVWFPGWSVPVIAEGSWPNGLLGFLETCPERIYILALDAEELGDFNTREQLAALAGSRDETV
jgi:CTP:molybdopterin cytidylyltransferase MocA